MKKVNLGGDRLGSGSKLDIALHGYERSTHDLSYMWKSTMAPGTLIPFMSLIALPGDTFDIELDSIVKTVPTVGPLFGSFKLQLDVFTCPLRLYNKQLHNNKLGLGMEMQNVKFPIMTLTAPDLDLTRKTPLEYQQINQSSILAYLGYRGIGHNVVDDGPVSINVQAIPLLSYWDIYKNYYANKQEQQGYVIHGSLPALSAVTPTSPVIGAGLTIAKYTVTGNNRFFIYGDNITINNLQLLIGAEWIDLNTLVEKEEHNELNTGLDVISILSWNDASIGKIFTNIRVNFDASLNDQRPKLAAFAIEEIDKMRDYILSADSNSPFNIITDAESELNPYAFLISPTSEGANTMSAIISQEGLGIKTYQSDIFNNWLSTENFVAITNSTAISTAGDTFSIDTLNMAKKVYDMLNRIAVSGGSYEDWLDAVYDNSSKWRAETPVYHGGLSKEVVFEEVVSQSATDGEPLGSLAGKGRMSGKHKGGKMIINIDEPCYILGIVSLTPRLDYSQGNNWDIHLNTMNDLHKPGLDGIGFQNLITDGMAFWDTSISNGVKAFKSAGYQPAWLNYMTNHNKSFGNFADERNQMFMTLDRRYKPSEAGEFININDLTTYIDPSKFNYAFAQTDLGAQNFWTQIACNITARRKMSAKIIPNL